MTIKLKIDNCDALDDGGPLEFSTSNRGFDIGREQHLDWTLPDDSRYISGRHCEIRYEQGGYFLYDVSRNGTFINGGESRVKSPYRLQNGDRIEVGHYHVAVTLEEDHVPSDVELAEAANMGGMARASDDIWGSDGAVPDPIDRRDLMPPPKRGKREVDFSEEFLELPQMHENSAIVAPAAPAAEAPVTGGSSIWEKSKVQRQFAPVENTPVASPPPPVAPQPPVLQPPVAPFAEPPVAAPVAAPPAVAPQPVAPPPVPVQPLQAAPPPQAAPPQAPPPAPAPLVSGQQQAEAFGAPPPQVEAAPPAPAVEGAELLQYIAIAAGLAPDVFNQRPASEVAHDIGLVLRTMTEQISQLLNARTAAKAMTKSSNRTMMGSATNPLKFIPVPEESLNMMFGPQRPGFLNGPESVREAFADLKTHEYATYSAMQKALGRLLEDMSPEAIESKAKGSAFSSKSAKSWEMFVARWEAKTEPYENGMLDVFLAHFSDAYDEASKK